MKGETEYRTSVTRSACGDSVGGWEPSMKKVKVTLTSSNVEGEGVFGPEKGGFWGGRIQEE
jgi:hypothetical protein